LTVKNFFVIRKLKRIIKIDELESLKGIAAVLIVFVHIPLWNSILEINLKKNANLMVPLFFVLSGFVIYNLYAKSIINQSDYIRFVFLRFGRIYPCHFFFLLFYILIELAKYIAQLKFNIISPNSQPFRENNIYAIVQHLFLVQALISTNNSMSFNLPAWSISVEFYTYLLFGLIILKFRNYKNIIFFGFFLTSFLLILTSNAHKFYMLISCFCGFFLGCLTCFLKDKINIIIPKFISFFLFIIIILFLIINKNNHFNLAIYFFSAILIFTLVRQKEGILNIIFKLKFLKWIGKLSYSIYMSHFSIIWFFNQFIRVQLKKEEIITNLGYMTPQLNIFETLIAIVILFCVVIFISNLVFKFIENPLRHKLRKYAFSKIVS
jgi:peptidoglycan/LPS O-acetylase OafA/YrhL